MVLASLFGFTAGCWLAIMEAVLRHPGYLGRIGVDACIVLISLATILSQLFDLGFRSERWLWVGAIALIGIGTRAFVHNARASHFEGFVVLISIAIVLQGLLIPASLGRPSHSPN
jgi:hypothetical protein